MVYISYLSNNLKHLYSSCVSPSNVASTNSMLPPTPIEIQILNTGKSLFTRDAQEKNGNARGGSKFSLTLKSKSELVYFQTKDATVAKDFEAVTYPYKLRAKGVAKQLLVTRQSSLAIPDGELALYFKCFGVVKKAVRQFDAFNHQISSCPRRMMLLFERGY